MGRHRDVRSSSQTFAASLRLPLHVIFKNNRSGEQAQRFFAEAVGVVRIERVGGNTAHIVVAACGDGGFVAVLKVAPANSFQQRRGRQQN